MKANLRLAAAVAATLAAVLFVSGCFGSGGGSTGPAQEGIAAITPANASLYASAVLRPQGDAKKNLDDFLSSVLATSDPGQKITDLIDRAFKNQGENRSFKTDVDPWLGDVGGVFTIGFAQNPPALVAVKATNPQQGVALLRSEQKSATPETYKGVSYSLGDNNTAFGAIDDFVAMGDQTAFKAAVDASKGSPLADSDEFKSATKDVPSDSLGEAYLSIGQLVTFVANQQGVPESIVNNVVTKLGLEKSLVVSASAEPKSVAFDLHGLGSVGSTPSGLLGSLPADATAAFGVSDLGGKINSLLDTIESAGIPGIGKGSLSSLFELRYGVNLEDDVLSWVGDAAVFIRGTDPNSLDGALVIKSKDDSAAARTMDKLRQVVESQGLGTPKPLRLPSGGNGFTITSSKFSQPLNFALQNGLFVIGVGQAATEDALRPTNTLAKAAPFASATTALGGGPSFYVSIPQVAALAAASPSTNKAKFAQARPYLDRLSYLTAGGGADKAIRFLLGAD